jgi:2-polyprenyl-6-methoxyphenol hydroxylase-like FAD-dependent oxidoreductase
VKALTDWHQFSLLSVASSRCRRWYKRGLLLIGDAAHTMTPAAGSGIKYAIEDAVVAANVLTSGLQRGRVPLRDLAEVQRQREWPTRIIQAVGGFGLNQLGRTIQAGRTLNLPRSVGWLFRLPLFPRLFVRLMAFGVWRVHVQS